jgi:hypothetical protein
MSKIIGVIFYFSKFSFTRDLLTLSEITEVFRFLVLSIEKKALDFSLKIFPSVFLSDSS